MILGTYYWGAQGRRKMNTRWNVLGEQNKGSILGHLKYIIIFRFLDNGANIYNQSTNKWDQSIKEQDKIHTNEKKMGHKIMRSNWIRDILELVSLLDRYQFNIVARPFE